MIELVYAYAHPTFYVIKNSKVCCKFNLLCPQKNGGSKKLFVGRFTLPARRVGHTEVSLLRLFAAATTCSCTPVAQSTRKHVKRTATGRGCSDMTGDLYLFNLLKLSNNLTSVIQEQTILLLMCRFHICISTDPFLNKN